MLLIANTAVAGDVLEEVLVFGRGEHQIGQVAAASEGAVGGADLYGANIAGLDPADEQIDGRVSRVEEPRTVRFGVKYNF